MPFCDWDNDDWHTLTFAIQQKNCILMLGPDIPIDDSPPLAHTLAHKLADTLAQKISHSLPAAINAADLAQVSQYYQVEKGRMNLLANVSAFHSPQQTSIPRFYRDIAALPVERIITASHDRVLAQALANEGKQPVSEYYHFKSANPETIPLGSTESPLVYYLYGSITDKQSLVLTENDLLDFLVGLSSKERPLPTNLLSRLHDPATCFLFLGFGFRHWYLRILLYILQGRKKESPSFAMEELMRGLPGTEIARTVFFFKRSDFKIHIYNEKLETFAACLREKTGAAPTPPPPDRTRAQQVEGASVFVCHAGEDKEAAATLHRLLAKAGLEPWLDRENLQPGDNWDQRIKETLDRVDYVVVLNSRALARRHEGYVVREINAALDRQPQFRRGFRFIFPVRIDDAPLLPELEALQRLDLPMAAGQPAEADVARLITAIRRDYIKRRSL